MEGSRFMQLRRARWHVAALIVATACVPAVVAAPAAATPVGDCQAGAGWAQPLPGQAARVVELVNQHRATLGLAPLAVSPTLSAGAVWKARHMATYRYLAHDDPAPPVQRTPAERVQACGYPVNALVGENIAAGQSSAESVMSGWLGSAGHRANIERASFAAIGVGAARAANGSIYWAQDFGSVADAGATVPQPAPAAPPPPQPASPPPAAAGVPALRVRGCERAPHRRRAAKCALELPAAPATVKARLLRRGKTVARGVLHATTPGAARIRLHGRHALRPGRAVLRLTTGETVLRHRVRLR
jgi:uncharacterized protein YkwD